jgi:hypothetical protein
VAQVLESLDLRAAAFGVILVEASGDTPADNAAVRAHLAERGYTLLGGKNRSDWFVNDRWDELYAPLGLQRPAQFPSYSALLHQHARTHPTPHEPGL